MPFGRRLAPQRCWRRRCHTSTRSRSLRPVGKSSGKPRGPTQLENWQNSSMPTSLESIRPRLVRKARASRRRFRSSSDIRQVAHTATPPDDAGARSLMARLHRPPAVRWSAAAATAYPPTGSLGPRCTAQKRPVALAADTSGMDTAPVLRKPRSFAEASVINCVAELHLSLTVTASAVVRAKITGEGVARRRLHHESGLRQEAGCGGSRELDAGRR